MVNEYTLENRYRIGNLKPFVYLLPKSTTLIEYHVDNTTPSVQSVNASTVHKIEGVKTVFNQTLNENTRFNFTSSVVLTMKEQDGELWGVALEQLRKDMFYVVFEDKEGKQYIQSPEFTSVLSWQYSFTNSTFDANICELTFSVDGNVPTCILATKITETDTLIRDLCQFERGHCFNLRLCPKKYAYVNADSTGTLIDAIYTTNGQSFKQVDFIDNTFTYQQSYKDNQYTEQITFSIPFEEYKYNFHYNLEEFKNNRYIALFETMLGVTVASGVEFGLFPKYTIQTSEEDATLNTITFTLQHVGQYGMTYMSGKDPSIIEDKKILFTPISGGYITDPVTKGEVFTEVCISDTQAIYTLLEAKTNTNQSTGKYYVLEGYEDIYVNFNIVGTYTQADELGLSLIYNSNKCSTQLNCPWTTPLPNNAIWNTNGQTMEFTVNSACDWTIKSIPSWLTNNGGTSGTAGTDNTLSFTSNTEPTDTPLVGQIVLTNGTQDTIMNVTLQGKVDWVSPTVFNITALPQDVEIILYESATITSRDISFLSNVKYSSGKITLTVQNNSSETLARTGTLTLTNSSGETALITINQDRIYTEWKVVNETDYVCDGIASYTKEVKYIGYTASTINTATNITRAGTLISSDDNRCKSTTTEWRTVSGDYICDGSNKYYKLEEYVSYDAGQTYTSTGNFKTGNLIEANSPDCDASYAWVDNGNVICRGGNLYQILEKFHTGADGVATSTGEQKTGEVIIIQASSCQSASENSLSFTFEYDTYGTTTAYMAKVVASTNFTVNWGDGTYTSYLKSDYTTPKYIGHAYTNTNALLNKYQKVVITGGITQLELYNPSSVFSDFYYSEIDLTNATELRVFYCNTTNKIYDIDLSNNVMLKKFQLNNNIGERGIENFVWPTVNSLQFLTFTNLETATSYITADQITKILTDAPTVSSGIMYWCYQVDKLGENVVCQIDASIATDKGWMIDQRCCETIGNKKYTTSTTDELTECDTLTYTKWLVATITESEYTADGWSDWVDTGKTIRWEIKELNSTDCGYVPEYTTIYDWHLLDSYTCDGYTSYYNEQYMYSNDDGATWLPVEPEQIRMSSSIKQTDDELCGYLPPGTYRERWVEVEGEYLCDNSELNCSWEKLWVPLGYVYDATVGNYVFIDKTVSSIPNICDGITITAVAETWKNLSNLETAPTFDSSNVTTWSNAFYGCTSLTTVPDYDYTKATDLKYMFAYCENVSRDFDLSAATNLQYVYQMFAGTKVTSAVGIDVTNIDTTYPVTKYCDVGGKYIETLEIKGLHSYDYDIGSHPNLNKESLLYMIKHVTDNYVTISMPQSMYTSLVDDEVTNAANSNSVTLYVYQV